MKKPNVICPACKDVIIQESTGNYVVVCAVVYAEFEAGQSNYENFTIVPSNCQDDSYTKCPVWRKEKNKNWAREMENYSSLEQAETIRV